MGIENIKSGFWQDVVNMLRTVKWHDYLDVLIVAIIMYYIIQLVRETRAMQLVKSVGVILGVYFVATMFSMSTLKFLLGKTLDYGLVVLVVLFQPELRRALERLGRSKITDLGKLGFGQQQDLEATTELIEVLVESSKDLSQRKEGALIVIEQETKLGDIASTGVVVDADPSKELITNIFFKNSPLHDGAMLIRENRIHAAACFLPLSSNYDIGLEYGTRHRAALGISEVSDSVTIVISEERGSITIANNGKLQQNLSLQNLQKLLELKLLPPAPEPKQSFFSRRKEKKNDEK